MKLFAVILMSILAYATGELEYLNFEPDTVYDSTNNQWISIKETKNRVITEVNVLQEITSDDWTLEYAIRVDDNLSPRTTVQFCDNTAETIQDANVIELFMKTLGLDDQSCPIQPQTITNPERNIEGYLELENYNKDQRIEVEMMLMKGGQPVLPIVLATILVNATDESEYMKFSIDFFCDNRDNGWISIENKGDEASRIDILQEITGDDWTVMYDIFVDEETVILAVTPLCGPAETTQDVNIMNMFRKLLSIENQSCPIQPQTIMNPKGSLREYIEVDNRHDEGMRVSINLSKGDLPIFLAIMRIVL